MRTVAGHASNQALQVLARPRALSETVLSGIATWTLATMEAARNSRLRAFPGDSKIGWQCPAFTRRVDPLCRNTGAAFELARKMQD